MNKAFALCSFLLLGVAGCNMHVDKVSGGSPPALSELTFAEAKRRVLQPRCLPCHGTAAGLDIENYGLVKARMTDIKQAVFMDRKMPPDSPLTGAEAEFLHAWMDAGAPEGVPVVTPPPPEEPLTASFASIRKKIFVPLCQSCHTKTGSAFTVPLDKLSDLVDSPRQLVVPGKPDDSFLLFAITRTDKKKMPPPKSGVRPLTPGEIAIIKQWIVEGAKP